MSHPIWPLFDLEVVTPRLTMRYVDDDLGIRLAQLAALGVHDPATMPFSIPWTDQPSPQLEIETLRYYWSERAATRPAGWHLLFAALVEGEVVGTSSVSASDFNTLRAVETGSWLGRAHQRQGLGRAMRLASLTLAFDGLGSLTAHTAAWGDNAASLGVTRSLGYSEEGRRLARRRKDRDELIGFRMDRAAFDQLDTDGIELRGVEAAREFLEIG